MRLASRWMGTFVVAIASNSASAAPLPVWDHSSLLPEDAYNISQAVLFEDFVLANGATLSGATIWLVDGVTGNDGDINSFDEALSWAIYEEDNGEPGTLLGSGNATRIQLVDTGQQYTHNGLDRDIAQVSFEFAQPISVSSGNFFLALHENGWGSGFDTDPVFVLQSASLFGVKSKLSTNLASPGPPWDETPQTDSGVVLYAGLPNWEQTRPTGVGSFGFGISDAVSASQFYFEETNRFTTLDVDLCEAIAENDDGVFNGFSGTLSWAIYTDAAGKPGSILFSGSDTSPELADTGKPCSATTSDLFRARISFGREIEVGAVNYWLALHEGAWGSVPDGSNIYWASTPDLVGVGTRQDLDTENPTDWLTDISTDVSFLLYTSQVFASGFEADVTCAWSNGSSIDCF